MNWLKKIWPGVAFVIVLGFVGSVAVWGMFTAATAGMERSQHWHQVDRIECEIRLLEAQKRLKQLKGEER